VREFLLSFGHDPDSNPELTETPARVVEAYDADLLSGYGVNVAELLGDGQAVTEPQTSGWVALSGIRVSTVCPHHLLLSNGVATVAYRPGPRLFGLGTLASLVDAYARRLALQESIGESIVQALVEHGGARAAYCELRLVHGCLVARGSRQSGTELVTTARRGGGDAAELALALGRIPETPA
jgi:GTP cyclohydrolase I